MAISQNEFRVDVETLEKGVRDAIIPFLDKYALLPDLRIEVNSIMGVGQLSHLLTVHVTNLRDVRH